MIPHTAWAWLGAVLFPITLAVVVWTWRDAQQHWEPREGVADG